jgi:hypothetical protein
LNLAETEAELARALDLRSELEGEIEKARSDLAALEQLRAEAAAGESTRDEMVSPDPTTGPSDRPPSETRGRPVAAVTAALARAPGLTEASPEQMENLTYQLSEGVCATEALNDVFGTINRQTLVHLIRDLGGC